MGTDIKRDVEEDRGTAKIPLERLVIFLMLLFSLGGCDLFSALTGVEECPDDLDLPYGYSLEQNQHGLFRPLGNSGQPLLWVKGQGTKCDAINRAWRQYNHDTEQDEMRWTVVDR